MKRRSSRVTLFWFMLYGICLLVLAQSFSVLASEVTCRIDVNGDKVCSDGSRTRTNVFGDEVTKNGS
ncbi:MAG: hypothetical protein G3W58_22930 [Pantoea ananatis]|nr:hypothetical protein [Pantoea ananatis]